MSRDYAPQTLAQMRQKMFDGLGFISLTNTTPRTLADLRTAILSRIGIPDPLGSGQTRALADLVLDMGAVLGFGAMGSNLPPGIFAMLTGFLNLAQQDLWRDLELDKGSASLPPLLESSGDETVLDYQPVLNLAIAKAKEHLSQPDAGSYYEQVKKYLADTVRRAPPAIARTVNAALADAQRVVYSRYELGATGSVTIGPFSVDGDTTTADPTAIQLLALANVMGALGHPGAQEAKQEYERYMEDFLKRCPPNATTLVNRFLKDAQERLFRDYNVFRMERWFTWTLGPGQRFYDIDQNDEQTAVPPCTVVMDPRWVTGAWTSNGDNNWRPLRRGIVPEMYNAIQTGPTTHYEIRSCIELWPTPIQGWLLRIKAFYCLQPLEADSDLSTIDWQAIYLTALGDAKGFYKQPDAQAATLRAREYIGDLVAGSHAGARYFPGGDMRPLPAVMPVRV